MEKAAGVDEENSFHLMCAGVRKPIYKRVSDAETARVVGARDSRAIAK